MLPNVLLEQMDSQELAEQMAYDMLQNSDVKDRIQGQIDIERSEQLSREERSDMMRRMLGR